MGSETLTWEPEDVNVPSLLFRVLSKVTVLVPLSEGDQKGTRRGAVLPAKSVLKNHTRLLLCVGTGSYLSLCPKLRRLVLRRLHLGPRHPPGGQLP